jgi:preprotein translocase subunit SecE
MTTNSIAQFLREAKAELLKVNWPNKKQTITYTLAVIGVSIAVAAFLGSLDYFFNYILKVVLIR